ncbi:MAG: mannose-1-phosphate guanylyltransferase [Planctomycetota bacterium]|jgi:mannose-1-phosphate guanylyltransferase|nr:mannose-1-phosphate guanylyltransferase [Planctomycetota bacterium]
MSIAAQDHVYAVIMAGGSGTRFWPISRQQRPKQLTRIVGDTTMIQATVTRLQPFVPADRILVIATEAIAEETRAQLPMLPPEHVIAEPVGRDTAPCVCLAAQIVHKLDPEGVMILLPADQVISPATRFQETLAVGASVAAKGGLVTYGITPRFAATGYGYVQLGAESESIDGIAVNAVQRFVEKPDQATAEGYVAEGTYRWNSGIFTWRADTVLGELAKHAGWLTEALAPVGAAFGTEQFAPALAEIYPGLDKISIDYALMEHATDIAVVTCDFDWDDVGSWDALYDNMESDDQGVRRRGDVLVLDSKDSLVVNEGGPMVTAIGIDGLTVVSTPDAVLVIPKGHSQAVKALYGQLQKERPDLT